MLGIIILGSLMAAVSCNGQAPGLGSIPEYINDGFNRFNAFERGFENFRPVQNTRPAFSNTGRPSIPFVNSGSGFPIPSLDSLPVPNFASNPPSLTKFPGSEAVTSISETVEELPQVILNNVASSTRAFQRLPQSVNGANPIRNLTSTFSSARDEDALTRIVKTIIAATTGESIDSIFSEAAIRKTEEQFQNILRSLVPSTAIPGSLTGLSFGPQTQTSGPVPFVNNLNGQGNSKAAPSAVSSVSSSSSASTVSA